jgi:hypothetical protein
MAKSRIRVRDEPVSTAVLRVFSSPVLRSAGVRCIISIIYNFFLRQYKAALLPGRVPVSRVDHELDKKIPFTPSRVNIYLDFVAFWVRTLSFELRVYKRRAFKAAAGFLDSMGKLYGFAAQVYTKNLSTTDRPFYIARPRFFLIHLVDPHLMCIPSLHVMVVIRTYTVFAKEIRSLENGGRFADRINEIHAGALAITEAILFVKQHSVNCVAASMYAMTCFDGGLFPPEEAEDFVSRLFSKSLAASDAELIRTHILSLYRRFLDERGNAESGFSRQGWEKPLVDFLRGLPAKNKTVLKYKGGVYAG